MKSLSNKSDALTVITQIDGEPAHGPYSWDQFCSDNSDMQEELIAVRAAIDRNGVYQGGGGAAPVFTVRISLECAVELLNTAFGYNLVLPAHREDVSAMAAVASLRGRDDIARQLIAASALFPGPVIERRQPMACAGGQS